MTENSWPENGGLKVPETGQNPVPGRQVPPGQPSPFPSVATATPQASGQGADSKSDAAKDEAGEVARHAKDAAQDVTDTAKDEAANVAAEVKTNARDLMAQAKSDLTDQAANQQQKVAEGLRSVSTELQAMVSASDQPGVATDLVRQAAERSSSVASWLDARDPGSLLAEVTSFARQKPGTFLLLAAGAGVLAGRLSRSLSAGAPDAEVSAGSVDDTHVSKTTAPDTAMTVPPVPVEPPTADTSTAGMPDTYPSSVSGAVVQEELGQQHPWGSEPAVTDPLGTADPLRDDPLDGGHR
ncbi:hypothetical protein [Arthrobacter sp. H35-D1]|uniref:hypothetical protein n=1 Tax=Arthrobacter sp. H35-D1 TaxID=3046202 RepID=UPI0024B9D80C|nr:hypothetical protein [Arthrobacter sp. H35-D1]MDJ0315247.1 hypothetical protein [Arthrobacter sp. H35-D1]